MIKTVEQPKGVMHFQQKKSHENLEQSQADRLLEIVKIKELKSKTELAKGLGVYLSAITNIRARGTVATPMALAAQAVFGVSAEWIINGKGPVMHKRKLEDIASDLLLAIGENTEREGLRETPKRMCKAWKDFFVGYEQNPKEILNKVFEEVGGYDEIVLLKNIRVESHCEHHFVPIIGHAHVAYLPNKRVVGISKLARVVEAYSKRLQVQERLTQEIADCITEVLDPQGVAVVISSTHHCMTTRGVRMVGANMVTSSMSGAFRNSETRQELFQMINGDNL